jgi:hypothetical protein
VICAHLPAYFSTDREKSSEKIIGFAKTSHLPFRYAALHRPVRNKEEL